MTLPDTVQKNYYELAGFLSSATASSFVFSEFLEKAMQVAVFAFITGLVGAAAGHLYKVIITKISSKNVSKETKD